MNTQPQDAAKVTNGIIIDMGNDNAYDAEGLKTELSSLREVIRTLAIGCHEDAVSASRYESNMMVLNYLIEEAQFKDVGL